MHDSGSRRGVLDTRCVLVALVVLAACGSKTRTQATEPHTHSSMTPEEASEPMFPHAQPEASGESSDAPVWAPTQAADRRMPQDTRVVLQGKPEKVDENAGDCRKLYAHLYEAIWPEHDAPKTVSDVPSNDDLYKLCVGLTNGAYECLSEAQGYDRTVWCLEKVSAASCENALKHRDAVAADAAIYSAKGSRPAQISRCTKYGNEADLLCIEKARDKEALLRCQQPHYW